MATYCIITYLDPYDFAWIYFHGWNGQNDRMVCSLTVLFKIMFMLNKSSIIFVFYEGKGVADKHYPIVEKESLKVFRF